jgi:redox-sensing transcriptional repressor
MAHLSQLALERLMRYYLLLSESPIRGQGRTITSGRIAQALDIDPTQVRKDFGAIGLLGKGRVGFDLDDICRGIQQELGFNRRHDAVLVGAGHLGSAILAYRRFTRYGLHFVAAFDTDPHKIGRRINGCLVRPMRALTTFVRSHQVPLAVVTTPAHAAQRVIDRLAHAGVLVIWNFAPAHPVTPPGLLVRNEHISLGLSEITHHLRRHRGPPPPVVARRRARNGTKHVALSSQS